MCGLFLHDDIRGGVALSKNSSGSAEGEAKRRCYQSFCFTVLKLEDVERESVMERFLCAVKDIRSDALVLLCKQGMIPEMRDGDSVGVEVYSVVIGASRVLSGEELDSVASCFDRAYGCSLCFSGDGDYMASVIVRGVMQVDIGGERSRRCYGDVESFLELSYVSSLLDKLCFKLIVLLECDARLERGGV